VFTSRGDLISEIGSINRISDMNKKRMFQRILNAREQALEAKNIRKKIQEKELKNYLESKSRVKREIKQIIEFGAKIKLTKAL
jgi:adenine-specific DNA glycosylase